MTIPFTPLLFYRYIITFTYIFILSYITDDLFAKRVTDDIIISTPPDNENCSKPKLSKTARHWKQKKCSIKTLEGEFTIKRWKTASVDEPDAKNTVTKTDSANTQDSQLSIIVYPDDDVLKYPLDVKECVKDEFLQQQMKDDNISTIGLTECLIEQQSDERSQCIFFYFFFFIY